MRRFDVCIIGGGAAGLAAAASLDKKSKVCIFEKNEILGRKLMATGGGRCNLTNAACGNKDATLDFFASMGIETYCDEEGRYFPYSNKASDVTTALVRSQESNVTCFCNCNVEEIQKVKNGFVVKAKATDDDQKEIEVRSLILATGGKAAPQYGTTGDGYRFAKALGHSVTKVYPVLAPVQCTEWFGDGEYAKALKNLKGIRAKGTVTLLKDGVPVKGARPETGEIQFIEDGLSGICVFNLTEYIKAEAGENIADAMGRYSVSLDLAPDFDAKALSTRDTTFGILTEGLSVIADGVIKRRGLGAELIKDWRFTVKNVKGWRYAQCTAGGIDINEIDMDTMESKIVPGLYLAGEVIDVQGPCGGFNLQNAWETGIKAAQAINKTR